MSKKQVDERVVSMQFDNKHFEQNVSTTMSTLDKLKHALKLDGASKGLEDVNNAAGKVNFSGMLNGISTVQTRFSYLQASIQHQLNNIVDSAFAAGKNLVSAFTIDPIKTGFSEYELKMGSVQTIMTSTGESLEKVNGYLNELNEYSDQTIYSFSDMTQNIGKFTNAGVKLEDAVQAIKGISNEAALSGANANEASRAMYNFAQALSAGHVKLIDWKSIENANMATVGFKEELIATALEMDTLSKAGDGMYKTLDGNLLNATKNFNETLQDGWMTSEVLIETLKKYASMETDIGIKAYAAAQDVKTFTMMMDTLKEAAQSGWAQTWELIVGDFEEAKSLWTNLSGIFGDIIAKSAESRNAILGDALGSKWNRFAEEIKKAGIETDKFEEKLKETVPGIADVISEAGSLKSAIDNGNISASDIIKTLKAFDSAQYDTAKALKNTSTYLVEQGDCLWRIGKKYGVSWQEIYELNKDIIDNPNLIFPGQVLKLQEGNIEITEEYANALKDLASAAEESGTPINELLKDLEKPTGRALLIESLTNSLEGLKKIFGAVGKAWSEIFDSTDEDKADAIYGIIEAIHSFSEKLKEADGPADKIRRTFKGLFAILDIVARVVGGVLKVAFAALGKPLGMAGDGVLSLTAGAGDAIVAFRDWLIETDKIGKGIEKVGKILASGVKIVKGWIDAFIQLPFVRESIDRVISSFEDLRNIDLKEVGDNILEGLKMGLETGIELIPDILVEIGSKILSSIKEVLGIHSPSTEMEEVGNNTIQGLVNGLQNGMSKIREVIKNIGSKIISFFTAIDWDKIFQAGISIGALVVLNKLADAFLSITSVFDGFGDICDNVADVLDSVQKGVDRVTKASAQKMKSEALKNMAISIAILAGALLVLSFIKPEKLATAGIAIGVLAAVLIGLAWASNKLNDASMSVSRTGFNLSGLKSGLLNMAAAILLLGITVKLIGNMDPDKAMQGFKGLFALVGSLVLLMGAFGLFIKSGASGNMDKAGKMLRSMAITMLLLVVVCKLVGKLTGRELGRGFLFVSGFTVFAAALIAVTKSAGKHIDEVGGMILKLSLALLLLVGVCKLIGYLTYEDMLKGVLFAGGFVAFVWAMCSVTETPWNKKFAKIGGTILSLSVALLMMAATCKLIGLLTVSDLVKGISFITVFAALVYAFAKVTKISNKEKMAKLASTILAMSLAIGIMAGIALLLGIMDIGALAKGIVAVGLLSTMIALMIYATRNAKDCMKNLIVMTVAIGVMAGAVAGLSFIDPARLALSTGAILSLMGMFALLMTITKYTTNSKELLRTLIVLTGVVVILAGVVTGLSFLNADNALKSASALSMLLLSFSASLSILSKAGEISKGVTKQLLPLLGVVAGLALILALMSLLKVNVDLESIVSLSALMFAMTGVLLALSKIKITVDDSIEGAISLTLLAIPLIAFVGVLAVMQNVKNATNNALALAVLAGVMTLLLVPLSIIGNLAGLRALLGVLALTAMAVPLYAFVDVLATMQNVKNATNNALTLAVLAGVMTLLLIPLAVIGLLITATSGLILAGVLGLLAMAVPLYAFVDVLAVMQNVENAEANAILLIFMASALTAMLVKISLLAPLVALAIPALAGLTALMIAIGALAVGIGKLMELCPELKTFMDSGLDLMIDLAGGIGELLGTFVTSFLTSSTENLVNVGTNLSDFMTELKPFIDGVKMVDSSVLSGVGIVTGAILALTVANVISGIGNILSFGQSFKDLGSSLSDFMSEAKGFIDGAATVDPTIIDGVKSLAEAILIITAANVVDGIIKFFSGESSLESFGEQLGYLGTGINSFVNNMSGVTADKLPLLETASDAVGILAKAAQEIPNSGGLVGSIVGNNDLGTFAKQFPMLGVGIAAMLIALGKDFGDKQVDIIEDAADAISALAKVAQEIPNSGGLVGSIVGNNDLSTFANQFPMLGTGITGMLIALGKDFGDKQVGIIEDAADAISVLAKAAQEIPNSGGLLGDIVGNNDLSTFANQFPMVGTGITGMLIALGKDFGDKQVDIIEDAADAISALAKASREIPNAGGLLQQLIGDNSLKNFADQLPYVGTGISGLLTNLGSFDDDKKNTVSFAADAISSLAQSSKTVGEGVGGLLEKIIGNSDLTNFAQQLPNVGTGVKGFADNLGSFDSAKLSTVTICVEAIKAISTLAGVDLENATSKIVGFADKLPEFGTEIGTFADSLSAVNARSLDKAIRNVDKVVEMIEGLSDCSLFDAAKFKKSIKELGETGLSKFITAFTDVTEGHKKRIRRKFQILAVEAPKGVTDDWVIEDFSDAGKDLGDGLISGINSKQQEVYDAGYALGVKAVEGERDGQASASPSKLTIQSGKWLGEGLVIGMEKMGNAVSNAGFGMGQIATKSISGVVSKIASSINTDIDTQPTIRPVLDLSDVQSGAGAINGMFGMRPSVSLMGNVNAIHSSINSNQNGSNNDIIAAIKDLGSKLGVSSGDNITIGDVTYDDGSNLNDAVKTIVRVARVERRK